MRATLFFSLTICLTCFATAPLAAGDWLGGEYWGRISGCASCGQSLYGWGRWGACGPGCGCQGGCGCGEDPYVDPYLSGPVVPPYGTPENAWQNGTMYPSTVPPEAIPTPAPAPVVDPFSARQMSYNQSVKTVPRKSSVSVATHNSKTERLLRPVAPPGRVGPNSPR